MDAYEDVTGESLSVLSVTERPDFICVRKDGRKVGVELVKVRQGHPDEILFRRLIEKQAHMSIDHFLEMLQDVISKKEIKRNESDWKLQDATILLIEIMDIPLAEIKNILKPEILPDLYASGFAEVWLVDFSGVEAYDKVQLFCATQNEWAGYHPRVIQKPYG